ncbi:MAG: Bax inhibitor-1/YccA family protein [Roseburia sp.]|nr:Bax inhibitor-1/YccA family protein [Roseburia sp.]MCM1279789.1 Bax inhibitor-1/YccA family protein [Robinsoniella sp.]
MDNYNPNDNFTNYQNNYNNGYNNDYSTSYSGQDYMNPGFESGNPVTSRFSEVRTVLAQEVVAKSFLFMVVALLITAWASLTTSPEVAIRMLTGYNFYILLGAELMIVLVSNWAVKRNNAILAGVLFAAYSYLTGVTFSVLFMVFTTTSITTIFLLTAALFGIMAVYGLATKKDLTSVGSLCFMGLIGIILAGVVNMFLRNSVFDTVISAIGVLVFVGLTAYDTQKIKKMVAYSNDGNVLTLALMGAFELYLDFINLFLKLLSLLGKKK